MAVSTGVLHHLAAGNSPRSSRAQADLGNGAFAHRGNRASRFSTFGAWVFHRPRMREVEFRHHGVLSARRAHPEAVLLHAALGGSPAYDIRIHAGTGGTRPDGLRPLVGPGVTAVVLIALACLALLDGAFSGFRAPRGGPDSSGTPPRIDEASAAVLRGALPSFCDHRTSGPRTGAHGSRRLSALPPNSHSVRHT